MIPLKIHCCWVGGKSIPRHFQAYIDGWRRKMPDAQVIIWNESNYDFMQHPYMADAFKARKWGFVPDFARLDIIYRHGGIYLDTDVEMIRPLYPLLENRAFCGFEAGRKVNFGSCFGAEAGNEVLKSIRDSYDGYSFLKEDGTLNLLPSPVLQTEFLVRHGLRLEDVEQLVGDLRVYPSSYFSPLDDRCVLRIGDCTYCIHHYARTWMPFKYRVLSRLRLFSERHFGPMVTGFLAGVKRRVIGEYR